MQRRGVEYRLVDSGQHADLTVRLRDELGVPAPDVALGMGGDVDSVAEALVWAGRLTSELLRTRRALLKDVFGNRGGVCVIHGDTPTTLITALLARRAGLAVAHLEAGLRSPHLFHPFPEEFVRRAVTRIADLLFAPHEEARRNLERASARGEIVVLAANTTLEALRHALGELKAPGDGPPVVTCHRVENLVARWRLRRLVTYVREIALEMPVDFVAHGPTAKALRSSGLERPLREQPNVRLVPLMSHTDFVRRLSRAPFVITDGGSIQEECFYLGVPTLLWRKSTERPEGISRNAVVSGYDDETVRTFLAHPDEYRRPPVGEDVRPSATILDRLERWTGTDRVRSEHDSPGDPPPTGGNAP
jgi:UDP-N-acetylglucosamine 2-epimerase